MLNLTLLFSFSDSKVCEFSPFSLFHAGKIEVLGFVLLQMFMSFTDFVIPVSVPSRLVFVDLIVTVFLKIICLVLCLMALVLRDRH